MIGNKSKSNSLGATLLETTIAIGILGIITLTAVVFFTSNMRQLRVEDAKSVVSDLAARLRSEASNPDNLRTSADLGEARGNKLLRDCLGAISGQACVNAATDPNLQHGFALIKLERRGSNVAHPVPIAGPGAIGAGGFSSPAYYSLRGELCNNLGVGDCVVKAEAFFWATCPLSAANAPQSSCPVALTIHVRIRVSVDDSVSDFYSALRGTSFPNLREFEANRTAFALSVPASDIIQKAEQNACGTGKIQVGFNTQGLPMCQCIGEYQDRTVGPSDVCNPISCPPNTYLSGFDPSKTPPLKCIDISMCSSDRSSCSGFNTKDCPCKCIELNPDGGSNAGQCPAGMWMTEINFGKCYATQVKKGGNSIVRCEKDIGICCRLPIK
jgi:type II secretory pathway pseudopilin PulG